MPIVKCANCGGDTYKRPFNIKYAKYGVYCSPLCRTEGHKKRYPEGNIECLFCGRKFRRNPAQVRREKTHFCNNECRLRYQRIPRAGGTEKSGYIYMTGIGKRNRQHRYIMEQYLGRKLNHDEDVHHINGKKSDNRIENLVIMSKSEHHRYHWTVNNPRKSKVHHPS